MFSMVMLSIITQGKRMSNKKGFYMKDNGYSLELSDRRWFVLVTFNL